MPDHRLLISASASARRDDAVEEAIPLVEDDDDEALSGAPPDAAPMDAPPHAAPADAPPLPEAIEATPVPPKDINGFLASLELSQYAGVFVANGIDFRAIPALERDDWQELGVVLGHRARIVKAHKASHPNLWH